MSIGHWSSHLRDEGHDVLYIAEIKRNSTDEEVLAAANTHAAVLITRDKGFGQMVFQQGRATHGVLLIRLTGVPMQLRKQLLAEAIRDHGDRLEGKFSVLTRSILRVRDPFPESPTEP